MNNKAINQKEHFRDLVDPYLSKWKLIIFCTIVALGLAFLYLRYATYQYQAKATIKIQDERQTTKTARNGFITKLRPIQKRP